MICKNQKEAFRVVMERDDQGGWWKCSDCGKTIRELRAHNLSHIKTKGRYPELKCETDNIEIRCYKCHNQGSHNIPTYNSDWLDE